LLENGGRHPREVLTELHRTEPTEPGIEIRKHQLERRELHVSLVEASSNERVEQMTGLVKASLVFIFRAA
jgi:hypothetical protein